MDGSTAINAIGQRAAERLAAFPAFLHANGFGVGGNDAVPVLDVARRVGVLDADRLRWSLQALLCGRVDEWNRFAGLFDAWFLPANRWQRPERRDAPGRAPAGEQPGGASDAAGNESDAARPRRTASREALAGSTDFAKLTERAQMQDVEALMRRFARELKHLQLRREAPARRGHRLDLPATIRRSVARGGTPLELAWRDKRRVRPRLVLLVDVSRSMAAYSFFYLRLARALGAELSDVHSFIFHTHLTGISRALRDPDAGRAQQRLHVLAQGWGGGTRIGDCIARFAAEHARRLVHARTAILIFSDGYDTGEPEQLAAELAGLRRRARRIVWLNPLAGRADYAPVSQGMQAALPYLDLLAPAADLASLRAVLPRLLDSLH